ncbi:MAG TPA: cytochrome P450 [Anaerolineales bacterium]|nr:cytochrome P450 [Anaerolineales bacterium]
MASSYHAIFSPEFLSDPYPTYNYLRAHSPICFLEDMNGWAVTGHREAVMVLKDKRFGSSVRVGPSIQENVPLFSKLQENSLVHVDQPRHTRLRGVLQRSFDPAIMRQLQGPIRTIVTGLLDDIAARGGSEIEYIRDFAFPVPTSVIAQFVGVPPSERQLFRNWSRGITEGFDINATPEMQIAANTVFREFREYILKLAEERRRSPRDDLMTRFVEAQDEEGRISEEELVNNCILLLTAGHETSASLLTNGILTLLQHPDQMARLKDNPSLMSSAIEEMMRYSRSLQMVMRVVKEDFELDGQRFKQGQTVVLLLSAANRDPSVFPQPDRFDIGRTPNPHLGFGYGIHHCLGAPLARVEAPIALWEFITRFPDVSLTDQPLEYMVTLRNLTLKELPLRIHE